MLRYKDWTGNEWTKQPMFKEKLWKTFWKPEELLLKTFFKQVLSGGQSSGTLEAKYEEMMGEFILCTLMYIRTKHTQTYPLTE